MVTWKSPGGVFAIRIFPIRKQITNKLIMQRKINNTVTCLQIGKNLMVKTPPGDFQVTTPETPLLSQQAVTSKESQVPY